jgi:N-acetyl sugar amidotransferase
MDTSDPDIEFDSSGRCNHCRDYERKWKARREPSGAAYDQLVEDIKARGAGREYDCLIGLSGGVDSSYVAWLVNQAGLRPLAVHLDNGWNSELAVKNIHSIVERLGIDLHTHVVDWEEFRDIQLAFIKASVVDIELVTDHAITACMYRTASRTGIPTIVTGQNTATEGIMPAAWFNDKNDLRNIRAIHRRFGSRKLKTYPTLGIYRYRWYGLARGIRSIALLDAVDYRKEEAMALLAEELGWRPYPGKHYESFFTRFYQSWILPEKFGIDKRRAHLSTMICSGQLSRAEALLELRRPLYEDERKRTSDLEYAAKKFGLSPEEFRRLIDAPPKSHLDYPSCHNSRFFALLRAVRRLLAETRSERG